MKNVFKTSVDTDGNAILWFSSRGTLQKVAVYTPEMQEACEEDDLYQLQMRDAQIYLKGFRKGLNN